MPEQQNIEYNQHHPIKYLGCLGYGNAVGDLIFRMCIDCNDAVFYWGFVFGGLFLRLLFFAVVFFAVVVVETWHAASLPDGTGTKQGRNRDGTGTEQGQGGAWYGG